MSNYIRTRAIVLRRTNYGEADRILKFVTENGVIDVIAHSARKEKSKLAGGIEPFSVNEITVYERKNGSLQTLTSAKNEKFFENIPKNLEKLNLGSFFIKQIDKYAENSEKSEYFNLLDESLDALNTSDNIKLIEAWFLFNLAKINGEQINLYRDKDNEKLNEEKKYFWDSLNQNLYPSENGNIAANEIKMMRLILSAGLKVIKRVKIDNNQLESILLIAKSINKI